MEWIERIGATSSSGAHIARQYINPDVPRSGVARLLKRKGMARLEDVISKTEGETEFFIPLAYKIRPPAVS
jgi:hypothetical protein